MTNAPLPAFAGYGIELEYMIVDRATLSVRPLADRLLDPETAERRRGAMGWSNELALHVVELKNRQPAPRLADLAVAFQAEVAAINACLEPLDAQLMPGAMHPWMEPRRETRLWPHAHGPIYAAYDRIFDCRRHGWANLQSMHLNLPFADDAEFSRLHAAVRLVLPILPALAASSPLVEGRLAGALDYRLEVYRGHQARIASSIGAVIPDDVSGCADYQHRILAPMYRELAPLDPERLLRHEWLNARGAIARFERSAIEIRVIDMQECPRADLAVAAAAAALVRRLYEREAEASAPDEGPSTARLAEILRTVSRDAERAVIADASYLRALGCPGEPCSAGELWRHMLRDTMVAEAFAPWREPLELILRQGPLARRILRSVGPAVKRSRLAAVYAALCGCLARGQLFAV